MSKDKALQRYSARDRVIDEMLVLGILAGEQRAVDRLGARWQMRLMRVAMHLTGDRELAEMAAQEAWVGICRNWRKLKEPAKFSPWAFGILRRKCFDAVRQKARNRDRSQAGAEAFETAQPALGELRMELSQAFDVLSAEHRTVAILYFAEELTLADIAAALDRPLGTIQSRIYHARRKLKAALSGEDNDQT
ncbi:MAG: sigma-70 family RNA polymerase sigma factor [Hyphomonadaceae bacterium]